MQILSAGSRKLSLVIPVVCVGACLAVVCSATALGARSSVRPSPIAGTWSGTYGGAFSGTFTLHWRQIRSRLVGSIALSKPQGTYDISGSVTRGKIKFGVVAVGAKYSGSVVGKTMSGRYHTPQGGGDWSAHKTS